MYSAYKLNKQGDNIQPWCTPFLIWNQSVVPCSVLTVYSWPGYRFLKRQVRWSGIPISFRILHSSLWSTQSKTLAWTLISHECTCVPDPEPCSLLTPYPTSQGCLSALALSALIHASNLDWWPISHMVIYMFQCYSFKSSHPCLLLQSPKVCSLYLCLFCCLRYRVIVTIFLKSIYMH